jgi:hypothetical protein
MALYTHAHMHTSINEKKHECVHGLQQQVGCTHLPQGLQLIEVTSSCPLLCQNFIHAESGADDAVATESAVGSIIQKQTPFWQPTWEASKRRDEHPKKKSIIMMSMDDEEQRRVKLAEWEGFYLPRGSRQPLVATVGM